MNASTGENDTKVVWSTANTIKLIKFWIIFNSISTTKSREVEYRWDVDSYKWSKYAATDNIDRNKNENGIDIENGHTDIPKLG